MSPLKVEAGKDFGIMATAEGVGEALENDPVVIMGKDREKAVDHKNHNSRFVPVREGETIVIPDVEEGEITVKTDEGLEISKESSYSDAPRTDQVTVIINIEGTGFPEEGRKPVTRNVRSWQAWRLKTPLPVDIGYKRVAEISWSEE